MSIPATDSPATQYRLRIWPGVALLSLQWLIRFVLPSLDPELIPIGIIGGMLAGMAIVLWWLLFSRASWLERVAVLGVAILAFFATSRLVHESIATGMMGMLLLVYAVPVISLALVGGAVVASRFSGRLRPALMVAGILLASGVFTLIRTGGITGDADSDFHWRWTATPEERLLSRVAAEPAAFQSSAADAAAPQPHLPDQTGLPASPAAADAAAASDAPSGPAPVEARPEPADQVPSAAEGSGWPGFRGPGRDSVIRGVRIETDWESSPPVELWRRPVGPGWSSFAVSGDRVYTQEQRGEEELVSCYELGSGQPVWIHSTATRFWESNAGAGPRATPTLSRGRVYTFGATGILNALDAQDGSPLWSRDLASDTGRKIPTWGFAASPLVWGDLLIAAAAGRLAAYDLADGRPRWIGSAGEWGYSSPHLLTLAGIPQILLLNTQGLVAVSPTDGAALWNHPWRGDGIVQPALTDAGELLIGSGSGMSTQSGLLRLAVAQGASGWKVEERWTSIGLKPYFNDFVVHQGHAFGFDGGILACLDVQDGRRRWKGGRYGHGQLLLLAEQDLLLVLSEEGELALVAAQTETFRELARFPAIEGKTWNHPVLVDDLLLVRNDREMAAFRLKTTRR